MARAARNWGVVHIIAASMMALAACSPDPGVKSESLAAGWPKDRSDFSVVWTADPAIDLTSGPSVAVRAYIESYYLAILTGDDKYLYPGFSEAVERNADTGKFDGTQELWPQTDSTETWVGTFKQHILRVDESGPTVTVVGCLDTSESGSLIGNSFKANIGQNPNSGVKAFRVQLKTPGPEHNEALPPQVGPSRAPFNDVFGGWRITNHQGGFVLTAEWPDRATDLQMCQALASAMNKDQRFFPALAYKRTDFPVLPPSPGWPA